MDFQEAYRLKIQRINRGLDRLLRQRGDCPPSILRAMEYSLTAGGKRLRPVLFLSAYELACSRNRPKPEPLSVLPMACALEMIHTYSLIHDDLPAMDNDDYRRGKLTSHKVFGEATAILAGDGLLNLAYEVMLENIPADTVKRAGYLKAMGVIAGAAGVSGMIGGQVADMENENRGDAAPPDDSVLDYIHTHKTEALITGSLRAGVLASAEEGPADALISYGKAYGLAFQITDDILDITGDPVTMGKLPGSDAKKGKLTHPARFGLEASKKMAWQCIDQAVSALDGFGPEGEFLRRLAVSMLDRNR